MKARFAGAGMALGLLLLGASARWMPLEAQGPEGRWPLQPSAGLGRIVAPFLEGWYENEDGTFTYSFGYLNLNDEVVQIPIGDANAITPARYDGVQPTVFLPGKHRGMFAVTIPASMTDDVWWTLRNPNGEVTKVPGRHAWNAYELDWNPRPHGSVPPHVAFDDSEVGRGPPGVTAPRTLTTKVGVPLTVSVSVEEVSVRDPEDPRFREPTPLRVVWSKYQGPVGGQIEFARHPSTPMARPSERGPANAAVASNNGVPRGPAEGPETIMVPSGKGTVSVIATFSAPGEYVLNAQVDNWRAPDSASADQCCWTNGYQRVTVTP